MFGVTRENAEDNSKRERGTIRMNLHINVMCSHVKL